MKCLYWDVGCVFLLADVRRADVTGGVAISVTVTFNISNISDNSQGLLLVPIKTNQNQYWAQSFIIP